MDWQKEYPWYIQNLWAATGKVAWRRDLVKLIILMQLCSLGSSHWVQSAAYPHSWESGRDSQPPGLTNRAHGEGERACFPLGAELASVVVKQWEFPLTQLWCAEREGGGGGNNVNLDSSHPLLYLTPHLFKICTFSQKAQRSTKFSRSRGRLN